MIEYYFLSTVRVRVLGEVELGLAWQELQADCGVGLAALIFSDDSGNARERHGRSHLFLFFTPTLLKKKEPGPQCMVLGGKEKLPVTGPLSSAHGSVGVSRKLYSAPVARGVTFFYSVR